MTEEPSKGDIVLVNFNIATATVSGKFPSTVLTFRLNWVLRCLRQDQCKSAGDEVASDLDSAADIDGEKSDCSTGW